MSYPDFTKTCYLFPYEDGIEIVEELGEEFKTKKMLMGKKVEQEPLEEGIPFQLYDYPIVVKREGNKWHFYTVQHIISGRGMIGLTERPLIEFPNGKKLLKSLTYPYIRGYILKDKSIFTTK